MALFFAWRIRKMSAVIQAQFLQNVEAIIGRGVNPLECFGEVFDFLRDIEVATSSWTYNVTNSTAPTTVNDAKGGTVTYTNTAGNNDRIEAYTSSEKYKLDIGDWLVFKARMQSSEASAVDLFHGLVITDSDYLGDAAVASDIIGFLKDDGDANIDFVFTAGSAAYTRQNAIATLSAAAWTELCFVVKMDEITAGKGRIWVLVNGEFVNSGGSAGTEVSGLPTTELCIGTGIQNGNTTANTMTMDYIGAIQSR
jgi:hypothetical protein